MRVFLLRWCINMSKYMQNNIKGVVILSLIIAPFNAAFATQGTMPHGFGVKSEGMGGVAFALPQDSLILASNPAGIARLDNRLDVGAAFLKVDNGTEFAGKKYDGSKDKSLYIIPQFGVNYNLDDTSSIGFAVVGNGVGTAYGSGSNIGGLTEPKSEFQQMVATLGYAKNITPDHSFGIGILLIRHELEIKGTSSIGLPEGKDESYGYGLRLGYLGNITDNLTFGLSYATRGYMAKLKRFKGLLPEGGGLDLPSNYGIGLAYKNGPWTIAADVQRVLWADVKTFGNPGVSRAAGAPGDSNGPGFGWRNHTIYKVGVAYDVNSKLTVRAGYNDANQLLDSRDGFLGTLAPAANHRHITVGSTYRFESNNELSVAYAQSFKDKASGDGVGPDATSSPYMGQHWFSLSYSYLF